MLNLYFVPLTHTGFTGYGGGALLVAAESREQALALARSHAIERFHNEIGPDADHVQAIETPVIEGVLAETTYIE